MQHSAPQNTIAAMCADERQSIDVSLWSTRATAPPLVVWSTHASASTVMRTTGRYESMPSVIASRERLNAASVNFLPSASRPAIMARRARKSVAPRPTNTMAPTIIMPPSTPPSFA